MPQGPFSSPYQAPWYRKILYTFFSIFLQSMTNHWVTKLCYIKQPIVLEYNAYAPFHYLASLASCILDCFIENWSKPTFSLFTTICRPILKDSSCCRGFQSAGSVSQCPHSFCSKPMSVPNDRQPSHSHRRTHSHRQESEERGGRSSAAFLPPWKEN
jgi:hypothetical protein